LIKDSLAAGGIAVTIASNALVDIIVIDLGIEHSLHTSFEPQLSVINLASRLDKLGHAYAKDVAWLVALDDHLEGSFGRGDSLELTETMRVEAQDGLGGKICLLYLVRVVGSES
jgi:hypothetical protein